MEGTEATQLSATKGATCKNFSMIELLVSKEVVSPTPPGSSQARWGINPDFLVSRNCISSDLVWTQSLYIVISEELEHDKGFLFSPVKCADLNMTTYVLQIIILNR